MTTRTFTHAELHKSKLNVRTNEQDAQATRALAESILRRGLLQPISVHPTGADAPTPWGVFAGGRRLHAIGQLIEAGQLPADWPIPATVLDASDAEIVEMSLGENILRVDLRDYEVHAAVAEAFDRGDDVATIAANLGQSEQWVARQLRLGKLARPIFDAYAVGELSYDQAAAYAATADAELQLVVFDQLREQDSRGHAPARIRALLKVGDRETAQLLLFVGEAVYVGQGGMIEPDLFADGRDARIRITDEELLCRLAEERFVAERERIRREAKRPDLRFAARPPQYAGHTDKALEIVTGSSRLPAGDIIATIEVDDEGQPVVRYWWANRSAKGAADKGNPAPAAPAQSSAADKVAKSGEALTMPDSAYAKSGLAIAKDQYGLSPDGLQLVRSLRRDLLRCLLVDQGGSVARDYLTWSQARALLCHNIPALTGCRAIVDERADNDTPPIGLYDDFESGVAARIEWRTAVLALRAADYMVEKDPATSLQLFLDSDEEEKQFAAAVVAGLALGRSADTPGWRIPAHDVLARACGADAKKLRTWWAPTAKWLGLFGRLFRLGTVQQFVDSATHVGFIKFKDPDLTAATVTALDPDNHKDPAIRARAQRWLPDLLAFGGDVEPPPIPAADEARVNVPKSLQAKAAKLRKAEQAKEMAE